MRVLLTGASRGIGRAIAERLAKSGARLALCASAPSPELDSIVAACRAQGAEAQGFAGDLAKRETPAALVSSVLAQFGGLDAIVSNAGIAQPGRLSDMSDESWDRIFAVNTRAPFALARAASAHLCASKGVFVGIASMSGVEPYPGVGAYSASKAALIMMARTLALEWADAGARANCISPGLFHSDMTAPIYADADKKAAREALVPLHRIGEPARDLAGLVEFLLSPDATYITGQNIIVDGGLIGSGHSHVAGRPKSGGG